MSSFSDSVKTRDQLELSHPYGSSGLRYPIHAPKLAGGRATGGTLRSIIISRTFFHIKVTNQMCFDQFWLNTLETKTRVMQTWHVKQCNSRLKYLKDLKFCYLKQNALIRSIFGIANIVFRFL